LQSGVELMPLNRLLLRHWQKLSKDSREFGLSPPDLGWQERVGYEVLMELKWNSKDETQRWAREIGKEIRLGHCVVLLSGPLGAARRKSCGWFFSKR